MNASTPEPARAADSEANPGGPDGSPGDVTLQTYEAAADRYRELRGTAGQPLVTLLDRLAAAIGPGAHVLELGSGPGNDAAYLEQLGLQVSRTDATWAFVEMLRADGHPARCLDVRFDDFGGPYDAVLADAVFLHLTRAEFATALRKARAAVSAVGVLVITLKEGDGDAWRTDKLDRPRHFTYWREPALRAALAAAGWQVVSIEPVQGLRDDWLYVLCRSAEPGV